MIQEASLTIDGRVIGAAHPPYVIAEAGVHHQNSVEIAKAFIVAARIAGADAVKFQTYTADRLATRWAPTYWAEESGVSQHDIFSARSLLTTEDYSVLFAYAKEVGITLLSTPFDVDAVEMLDSLGMSGFKLASADITNLPLIEACARTGKPLLMSTGASTLAEVDEAHRAAATFGSEVVLLHCSLAYPTPVSAANLGRIAQLRNHFPDVLLGYSDHTSPGDTALACPVAVSLGCCVIEKHMTLNRLARGDDHGHSVDGGLLAALVRDCYDAWLMCKDSVEITDSELPARSFARRSIVAAQSIPTGHRITMGDIDFKRPGTGLPPSASDKVIGRVVRRDLSVDELIALDDLE